jgi:glycosyltransferase involved in cell wall biosynthesis
VYAPEAAATLPVVRGPGGRRLRVAHLTTVDMSLWLLLAAELRADVEAGFDVIGLSAPGPHVADVERLGVRHVALSSLTRSWDPVRDLAAARELAGALRTLRPDVLHTHNPKTGVLGRVLGRALWVPVVVNTCHGLWAGPDDAWKRRAPVYLAEATAALFSHAELYQNAADRDVLQPVVRGRGRVVGNGVDLGHFRHDPAGRARVRARWEIADDEVLVGGVGRLVAEKGILEFAAAAEAVGDRARFVWVGPEDPDKPDAVRDIGDRVRLVGVERDMPAVYSALDVFVLPSHREGFSRSAMEAAACGTAMVLSDIRGCREIGQDGRHLLLVPPRDPARLAEALLGLRSDPDFRQRLGEAAHRRAVAQFDQRAVARTSIETYAAVARRRRLEWEEGEVA